MSIKRIKNLVKQLNEYRHAYYNQDAPLVSDAEYDRLFDKLTGCTIVATGKLEHFTRDGINDKILELGAKPGSSVTKKTDYLICGEKAGSKLAKAQSLGIPILTEAEFLGMIHAL